MDDQDRYYENGSSTNTRDRDRDGGGGGDGNLLPMKVKREDPLPTSLGGPNVLSSWWTGQSGDRGGGLPGGGGMIGSDRKG